MVPSFFIVVSGQLSGYSGYSGYSGFASFPELPELPELPEHEALNRELIQNERQECAVFMHFRAREAVKEQWPWIAFRVATEDGGFQWFRHRRQRDGQHDCPCVVFQNLLMLPRQFDWFVFG